MQFTTDVTVKLVSGAEVTLTPAQEKQVHTFINNLLNGTNAPKVKRAYTKRVNRSRWTPQDDLRLLLIKKESEPRSRHRRNLLRAFAHEQKRTITAIKQRLFFLKQGADVTDGTTATVGSV